MKTLKVVSACLAMALYCSTAFGDVAGSSAVVGSWTSTGTYSSTITLADPGGATTITDVTVGVIIDHTWSSDVVMTLSDGTSSVTFNANQGDASDYSSSTLGKYFWNDAGAPVDTVPDPLIPGLYSTDAPLNGAFASSDATWTLTITDGVGGDGGTIGGWNLSLTTIPEPTTAIVLGIVGSMALIRRRR